MTDTEIEFDFPVAIGVWQPIESAPKDGRTVLLYQKAAGRFLGWWAEEDCEWRKSEGGLPWAQPTDWASLPDEPQ